MQRIKCILWTWKCTEDLINKKGKGVGKPSEKVKKHVDEKPLGNPVEKLGEKTSDPKKLLSKRTHRDVEKHNPI